MGAFGWFPVYDGNPYTYIGAYNAAQYNNGAIHPLGLVAQVPLNPAALASAKGKGSWLTIKYVRYNSTANPAVVAGPAPVYWTDETFTTVSGAASEGFGGAGSVAGVLLANSTSISGFTNTQLNGNYVWIGLTGFIPACVAPASTAAGDLIVASGSGSFTFVRIAQSTSANGVSAPTVGRAASAIASSAFDLIASIPAF